MLYPNVDRSKFLYTPNFLLSAENQKVFIDQTEAPEGFVAVPKDTLKFGNIPNICTVCEWRKGCIETNGSVSCMSDKRKDGIGVFFKKKP